jgi:type IV secretory pathway VirB10-like protein
MWITPLPPSLTALGGRSHGSILNGNYLPNRLSSAWKSTTVLSENLKIPPTISVPQGERIFIFVRQDLDFSAMYDDPVTEAMREIKRERSGR